MKFLLQQNLNYWNIIQLNICTAIFRIRYLVPKLIYATLGKIYSENLSLFFFRKGEESIDIARDRS